MFNGSAGLRREQSISRFHRFFFEFVLGFWSFSRNAIAAKSVWALTFVMGCALRTPAGLALNGVGCTGVGLAGVHGLGCAAAPAAVRVAAAAPAVAGAAAPAVAAAPVAYGAGHCFAGPVVARAPVACDHPAAPAPKVVQLDQVVQVR